MEKNTDFSLFLQVFFNKLGWQNGKKNDRMDIFVAEILDCTKSQASFEDSFAEADLSELLWLDLGSRFVLALPIPYVQTAILNLLNPYMIHCMHGLRFYCILSDCYQHGTELLNKLDSALRAHTLHSNDLTYCT